jgi:hypothetical protein
MMDRVVGPKAHERQDAEKQNHSRDAHPEHTIRVLMDGADARVEIPSSYEESGMKCDPPKDEAGGSKSPQDHVDARGIRVIVEPKHRDEPAKEHDGTNGQDFLAR